MSNRFDPEELDSALQNEFAAASASITPSEELLEKMSELGEPTKKRKSGREGKSRVVFSAAAAFLFLVAGAGFWIATQRDDSTETAEEAKEGEAQSNQEAEDAALQVKVDEKVAEYEECLAPIDTEMWLSQAEFPDYYFLTAEGYVDILTGGASKAAIGTDAGFYESSSSSMTISEEQSKFLDRLQECSSLEEGDEEEISSLYEKFDSDKYMKSEEYLQYQANGKKLLEQCLLDNTSDWVGKNGPEDELLARLLEEVEPGLADKMRNESGVLESDEVGKKLTDQGLVAVAKEKQAALEEIRIEFMEKTRCVNKELLQQSNSELDISERFVKDQDVSVEAKANYISLIRNRQKLIALAEEDPAFYDEYIKRGKAGQAAKSVENDQLAKEIGAADIIIQFKSWKGIEGDEAFQESFDKLNAELTQDALVSSHRDISTSQYDDAIKQFLDENPSLSDEDDFMWLLVNFNDAATTQQIEDSVERYQQQLRLGDKIIVIDNK